MLLPLDRRGALLPVFSLHPHLLPMACPVHPQLLPAWPLLTSEFESPDSAQYLHFSRWGDTIIRIESLNWSCKFTVDASLSLSEVKRSRAQWVKFPCAEQVMECHSRYQWVGIPEGRCVGSIPYTWICFCFLPVNLESHTRDQRFIVTVTNNINLAGKARPNSWDLIRHDLVLPSSKDCPRPRAY